MPQKPDALTIHKDFWQSIGPSDLPLVTTRPEYADAYAVVINGHRIVQTQLDGRFIPFIAKSLNEAKAVEEKVRHAATLQDEVERNTDPGTPMRGSMYKKFRGIEYVPLALLPEYMWHRAFVAPFTDKFYSLQDIMSTNGANFAVPSEGATAFVDLDVGPDEQREVELYPASSYRDSEGNPVVIDWCVGEAPCMPYVDTPVPISVKDFNQYIYASHFLIITNPEADGVFPDGKPNFYSHGVVCVPDEEAVPYDLRSVPVGYVALDKPVKVPRYFPGTIDQPYYVKWDHEQSLRLTSTECPEMY